jgi:hypothetical protein
MPALQCVVTWRWPIISMLACGLITCTVESKFVNYALMHGNLTKGTQHKNTALLCRKARLNPAGWDSPRLFRARTCNMLRTWRFNRFKRFNPETSHSYGFLRVFEKLPTTCFLMACSLTASNEVNLKHTGNSHSSSTDNRKIDHH